MIALILPQTAHDRKGRQIIQDDGKAIGLDILGAAGAGQHSGPLPADFIVKIDVQLTLMGDAGLFCCQSLSW